MSGLAFPQQTRGAAGTAGTAGHAKSDARSYAYAKPRASDALPAGELVAPGVRSGTWCTPVVRLEDGTILHNVVQRWTLVGTPNAARDNIVLATHALTGTADVHEWWADLVGDGRALDTSRYAVLCANVLGGCAGSTGPCVGGCPPFPAITTRDQAARLWELLDAFHVTSPALVVGGSLGGMLALEVAALRPARIREVVVLAAPAVQTALGAGWHTLMRTAVKVGGARDGLALARMAGMLSYRSAAGFESRFGHATTDDGTPAIATWLAHHGERLVRRFDPVSYVALIDAMDRHDVGHGRGGVARALRDVAPRITGVGIPGDLLYPAEVVQQWTRESGARYVELNSLHGHDAFLLETEQVSTILRDALARSSATHAQRAPHRDAVTTRNVGKIGGASIRPVPRIALAGCGTVGDALAALIADRARSGWHAAYLSSVLVRDTGRARPGLSALIAQGLVAPQAVTRDPTAVLRDAPDILVEAIGGIEPARTLVESALRRGIRVVTANKALIAAHGPALLALARAYNTTLDFEGAVAASVPVVRALRTGSAGGDVVRITGVLNGTTNAILDAIASGSTFEAALAAAQADGFAEADPSRDLDGRDAEDKLRVLAWLAFGVAPQQLVVERRGLDAAVVRWAGRVAAQGGRVRLIASIARDGDQYRARIHPERVAADDAWGGVRGAQNRVEIVSAFAGTLTLEGPGAGGHATALAILSDVLTPNR